MSSYEERLKRYLRKDQPMAEIRMKAKDLSEAFKKANPKWEDDPKLKRFVKALDHDPEGLVQLMDEEGVTLV